jgi:hypothetical protein
MVFFVLLGLYLMFFVRDHLVFILPVILSWIAAYYSKSSVQMFFITLAIYFALMYRNGSGLNLVLKKRNLWMLGLLVVIGLGTLQFLFVFYRDAYDSVHLFGRGYRSPAGAIVFWIGQEFFTKNAILIFLATIYSGHVIVQILERNVYNRYDVLFFVWLFLGTGMFALVSFVQLGYYVYIIFPLIALAVRGILFFGPMMGSLFEKGYKGFKFIVFVLGFYLVVVHSTFLSFWPIRKEYGWDVEAVKYLMLISIIAVGLLTVGFFFLKKKKIIVKQIAELTGKKCVTFFVVLILLVNLTPIASWAVRPKYELAAIFEHLNGFERGSIFIGDWAPQLLIDTPHRVLYTVVGKGNGTMLNFQNLDRIQPDYLLIVDGLNDYMLDQFRIEFPGVAEDIPRSSFNYAGRKILLYKIDFGREGVTSKLEKES